MTAHEMSATGDVLATLSDWMLRTIAANAATVAELAANELLARTITGENVDRVQQTLARHRAARRAVVGEE